MTDKFELDGKPKPKKKIVTAKYTESFEKWWRAYPRKTAKFKAFASWEVHVDETIAKVVIADTEKRNRLRFWAADKSKIPMPTTFLNQHRWEDEWEDEVKTRGKETIATYSNSVPQPKVAVDTGHNAGSWMSMLNRIMRNYLLRAGGLTDSMLKTFVQVKNDTHTEMLVAVTEEIDAAPNKPKARGEMAYMMATTMLSRFDAASGLNLKSDIIKMSKR